ncbi:unnamed protein product [Parnassius apollo]|uniref:(apollo) hypothetical protein n=1 Tax=Parnassius apollo TaxID=110799 RepID=A0A8S3W153_PARAO|nr:unnamed protein product [Parnassius apollo]
MSPSLLQPSICAQNRRTSTASPEMDMIVTDPASNPLSITENKLVQSAQEASISTPTLETCNWSNNAAPVDVLDGKPVDMTPSLFQTTPGTPVIRRSSTVPEAEIASNEQGSNTISTSKNKLVQLMSQKQKPCIW